MTSLQRALTGNGADYAAGLDLAKIHHTSYMCKLRRSGKSPGATETMQSMRVMHTLEANTPLIPEMR